MEAFRHIGLIGRKEANSQVLETIERLIDYLLSCGVIVVLEDSIAQQVSRPNLQVANRKVMSEICDLAIVVGGDGSMLGAARAFASKGVPVLGVNRGNLGFLTDILPSQIETKVGEVLAGKYTQENRFLLDAIHTRGGEPIGQADALNDVVISSGETAKMIEFDLYIEGNFVYRQRSDGLIISSPTGSTAYSLSAGGPIMHPNLDAIVLVPMLPHSLSSRPIVVDGNSEVKLIIGKKNQISPHITCDGQSRMVAAPGDTIYVQKKPRKLKMIHPLEHSFYEACRDKLGWSLHPGE